MFPLVLVLIPLTIAGRRLSLFLLFHAIKLFNLFFFMKRKC